MTNDEIREAGVMAAAISEHVRNNPSFDAELRLPGGDVAQVRVLVQRALLEMIDVVAEIERLRALFPDPEADARLLDEFVQIAEYMEVGDGTGLFDLRNRIRQVTGEQP